MASNKPAFGAAQLAYTDSRLALAVVNHLRYQALNRAFGTTREQANVLTAVVILTAADGVYEATRWVARLRPHVSGTDAALAGIALRDASLGFAGPAGRATPQFGTLVALAMLGGLASPSLRRAVQRARETQARVRAAEQRVRRERIRRYAAARASAA